MKRTNKVWFVSDLHWCHANVIKYCNRPFDSVEEMNETLITNFNECVHPHDTVYMLGDIALTSTNLNAILTRLNGHKHLIFGNHDKEIRKEKYKHYFAWTGDYKEIKVEGQHIILMHYAMRTWNKQHRGAWQLYGHSHNNLPELPTLLSMDVGVDANDYKPISFEQVKAHMEAKIKFSIENGLKLTEDHHTPTSTEYTGVGFLTPIAVKSMEKK